MWDLWGRKEKGEVEGCRGLRAITPVKPVGTVGAEKD